MFVARTHRPFTSLSTPTKSTQVQTNAHFRAMLPLHRVKHSETNPEETTMNNEAITQLPCAECGQPVLLTDAKTNDFGAAVHEDCYARRVQSDLAARTKAS